MLQSSADAYIALGRIFGLLLVDFVLLQVMLLGRARWLESVFGLDKLAKMHRFVGKWTSIFLIGHPLFLVLGYQKLTGVNFFYQLWDFQVSFEDVWHASVGFVLFLFVIVYSILMSRRKWDFEKWYWAHLSVYVAIILAFGHQTSVGGDFLGSGPIFQALPELTWFALYWYLIYAFVFGNLAWYRICAPLKNFYTHTFTVSQIKNETPDVWSLYITGKDMQNFHYTPGQFIIIRFLAKGYYWQAHPFSFSSYPNPEHIRLSIKASGDFTKTVGQLPVGTKAYIEGPYGTLTAKKSRTNKILMIAGGIGITPFRGILEDLGKAGKDIHLIYGNKTEDDIALRGELEILSAEYSIKIHHVLSGSSPREARSDSDARREGLGEVTVKNDDISKTSRTPSNSPSSGRGQKPSSLATFSKGFVTPELISQLVPDVTSREAFLCGPPPMMDALFKTLIELGVPPKNIFFEKFAL